MTYWEYESCLEGYRERKKGEYVKMATHALWTGNFKKGTTIKTLLGYDPYKKESAIKPMTEEEKIAKEKEVNKVMPPLDLKEFVKLKRKIREAKGK